MSLEVEGLDTLKRSLDQAGADLEDLSDLHNEVGHVVVRKASDLAPRRTGRLSASLRAQAEANAAVMGASVPYAVVVHFGSTTRHIKARPFLTNAITATEPTWRKLYMSKLEEILGRVNGDG